MENKKYFSKYRDKNPEQGNSEVGEALESKNTSHEDTPDALSQVHDAKNKAYDLISKVMKGATDGELKIKEDELEYRVQLSLKGNPLDPKFMKKLVAQDSKVQALLKNLSTFTA